MLGETDFDRFIIEAHRSIPESEFGIVFNEKSIVA